MKIHFCYYMILLNLGVVLPSPAKAVALIDAGEWKIEVTVQVDGRPKATPTVFIQCLNDLKALIEVLMPQPDCSVFNTLVTDKEISWDISCVAQSNTTKGSAKLHKSLHQLNGDLQMRVGIPGTAFNILTIRTIHAVRLSDCH